MAREVVTDIHSLIVVELAKKYNMTPEEIDAATKAQFKFLTKVFPECNYSIRLKYLGRFTRKKNIVLYDKEGNITRIEKGKTCRPSHARNYERYMEQLKQKQQSS